ncbi:MAG: hypothetical protein KDJ16_07085 [Hyphomicrobiales bacterium]|nr:hypothetical protein [Hyphomicrobiales bacterium]
METPIFLAKLIGPFFVVMGLSVLVEPKRMQRIGREFLASDALIYLSGVLTLPAGLAIVLTHNHWVADWPVIITIFGWVAILAGISRMCFSGLIRTIGSQMIEKTRYFAVQGAAMVLLGLVLAYFGYLA